MLVVATVSLSHGEGGWEWRKREGVEPNAALQEEEPFGSGKWVVKMSQEAKAGWVCIAYGKRYWDAHVKELKKLNDGERERGAQLQGLR